MITIREYKKVQSLEEAYELNQKKSNRIIGGMIWLKMETLNVGTAIDLSGLGLDAVEETETEFRIGAMTTLRTLETHEGLAAYTNGAMRESVRHIVGVQLRNLATLGGSLYSRFGFSDVLTMFLALDASVELYKGGIVPLCEYAERKKDRDVLVRVIVPKKAGARFDYRSVRPTKTYLYRIHNHPIDSPFDAAYYTRVPRHLDEAAMQAAAQRFVGRYDFLALCAAGSSAAAHGDTVRTITACTVTRRGDEVEIEVTADGYLYNMVRILAGTLCEVGAGRMQAEDIPAILASRDRSRAGPTLPAKGLFLKSVEYPEMKENQP